jgi:hypothetical protein
MRAPKSMSDEFGVKKDALASGVNREGELGVETGLGSGATGAATGDGIS